jgi:glycogen operon protein
VKQHTPDFSHESHSLAFSLKSDAIPSELFAIFNAYREDLEFEMPPGNWKRLSDSAQLPPNDFSADLTRAPVFARHYHQKARSSSVLVRQAL